MQTDVMDDFVLYLRRKGLAARTIDQHCRRLQHILPFSLERFTRFIVNKNPSWMNKYLQTGKHYCELHKIKYPKGFFSQITEKPKARLTLSDEEIRSFLALGGQYTCYWYLLAYHGFRPGEVRNMRVSFIDLAGHSVTLPHSKTGTGRTVRIHDSCYPILKEYIQKCEDRLFTVSDTALRYDFRMRLKKLGITKPLCVYSFRHSFATRMLQEEQPLFVVQDILGHSDPKTTRMYYHGNLKAQEKAMKNDPLNIQTPEDKLNKIEDFIKNTINNDSRFNQTRIRESITLLWQSTR
jgi:integrase